MIPHTFILSTNFPVKKLAKKLHPNYTLTNQAEEAGKGILLDTFDRELQAGKKLLFEQDNKLLLVDTTSGIIREQPGNASKLCTSAIKNGMVKELLEDAVSELRAFLPITRAFFYRETRLMLDDEDKTVARLHSFVFQKKKKHAELIISQPLKGYEEEYKILIQAMQQICSPISSLYQALGIRDTGYCSKPRISLSATAPIRETSQEIITTFIDVARQNEAGIQQDYDTEFLHDYRVSLRKVRSVISLFKGVYSPQATTRLKEEFASLMQPTGRLRDLDVYLLDKQNYFKLVPQGSQEGLEILFKIFEEERGKNHKKICRELSSKSYRKRINSLRKSFTGNEWEPGPLAEHQSQSFACAMILKRYKKVCNIARSIDETTEDRVVHDLRIHCKKLRYLMEFFAPLFPSQKIKSLIKSLKVLQDNLGRFNDYSVQQQSLAVFLTSNPVKGADGIKVAESIGALTAMLNVLQQQERSLVMENFARFDSMKTRTLFDNLFSREG